MENLPKQIGVSSESLVRNKPIMTFMTKGFRYQPSEMTFPGSDVFNQDTCCSSPNPIPTASPHQGQEAKNKNMAQLYASERFSCGNFARNEALNISAY